MGGRPRKPTRLLKFQGTYEEKKQGGRADEEPPDGKPRMPAGLSTKEKRKWKLIAGNVPDGIYGKAEELLITGAVKWHTRYEHALQAGLDGDAQKAWKTFTDTLAKLGATPVDRAKLQMPTGDKGKSKLGARKRA